MKFGWVLVLTSIAAFAEETYPVSKFVFKYLHEHPQHLPLSQLDQMEIALVATSEGFLAPGEVPSVPPTLISLAELNRGTFRLSKQALSAVLETAHQFFELHGVHWSYLNLKNEPKDELVAEVSIPTVGAISIRASEHSYLQNPAYVDKQKSRIEANFPLALPDPSTGYPGALVDPDALNNYLYSLNRHPGKRVDLEVGPTKTPGGVTLDFVITEEQPYHFYLTATNNIPKVIDRWQESIGFLHTQLTGRDDILKFNYSTDSFDSFYTANASYEAPWGLSHGKRWSLAGTYNRFLSAEFGLGSHLFRGTQAVADFEFNGVLYQKKKFFLEGFGTLEYRHIHNRAHFIHPSVMKNFIFPAVGVKCLQLKAESKIIASLQVETTISDWFWDVKERLDALGRRDLSPSWAFVEGSLYWSFYLEPLMKNNVERMASELVILGQLQNAFNFRLIPQLEGILGGVSTVRGYPQSTVSGDNLYLGSAEFRLHIPQLLKPSPESKGKFLGKEFRWAPPEPKGRADWDLVLRAFYDIGKTTNNHPVKGERNYLVEGIGWGADFVLWSNLVLKFDWGIALKSAQGTHRGHQQSYFSAVMMY
jgi:hemolysin activation/secretion protein